MKILSFIIVCLLTTVLTGKADTKQEIGKSVITKDIIENILVPSNQKMGKIILHNVEFDDADINSLFDYLSTNSIQYDHNKEGILILPESRLQKIPKVTMSFNNIPMSELLRYLSQRGVKYRVDSIGGISFWIRYNEPYTEYFAINGDFMTDITGVKTAPQSFIKKPLSLAEKTDMKKFKLDDDDKSIKPMLSINPEILVKYFTARGISFNKGTGIVCDDSGEWLIVQNYDNELSKIKNILQQLEKTKKMENMITKGESASIPGEFKPPAAGSKIELELEGGRIIKGKCKEITPERVYVYLDDSAIAGFKRRDISENTRWKYFKPDYDKKLLAKPQNTDNPNNTTATKQHEDSAKNIIMNKLKTIKIPKIDFEDVPIPIAVKYLNEQSKQLDSDGVGVNIILRLSPEDSEKKGVVNLILTNKTLGEMILFLCAASKLGFRVDENAVVIDTPESFLKDKIDSAERGNAEAQYELGSFYERAKGAENFTKAVSWYQKSAEQGNAYAQFRLGLCYQNGSGLPKNIIKAVEWLQKAAEQGNIGAQCMLGIYYSNDGDSQNVTRSFEWFQKAAEQGDSGAQYFVAKYYASGKGVAKDEHEAVKWWRKSAEQGNAGAQYMIGLSYELGINGLAKNINQAVELFRKAAEGGDAEAQCHLGACYEIGDGVILNKNKAIAWYRKAAAQGDMSAKDSLRKMGY